MFRFLVVLMAFAATAGLTTVCPAAETESLVRGSEDASSAFASYCGQWGRIRSWTRPGYGRALAVAADDDGMSLSSSTVLRHPDQRSFGSTFHLSIAPGGFSTYATGVAETADAPAVVRIGGWSTPYAAEAIGSASAAGGFRLQTNSVSTARPARQGDPP